MQRSYNRTRSVLGAATERLLKSSVNEVVREMKTQMEAQEKKFQEQIKELQQKNKSLQETIDRLQIKERHKHANITDSSTEVSVKIRKQKIKELEKVHKKLVSFGGIFDVYLKMGNTPIESAVISALNRIVAAHPEYSIPLQYSLNQGLITWEQLVDAVWSYYIPRHKGKEGYYEEGFVVIDDEALEDLIKYLKEEYYINIESIEETKEYFDLGE